MKLRKINFKATPNYEAASKIALCFWKFRGSNTWRVVDVPKDYDNLEVRRILQAYSYLQKNGVYYMKEKNIGYATELLLDMNVVPLSINANKQHTMN